MLAVSAGRKMPERFFFFFFLIIYTHHTHFLLFQKSMLERSTNDFQMQAYILLGDNSGRVEGINIQIQVENGMLYNFLCKEKESS